jgi:hypothetical protein
MFDFKQLLKSLETSPSPSAGASPGIHSLPDKANQNIKISSIGSSSSSMKSTDDTFINGKRGGIVDNENMKTLYSTDKVESNNSIEQNPSKEHMTKTATSKLLDSLMTNLKNMHNIVFKDVLNQTSILVNNASNIHTDGGLGSGAEGGILDQTSSFLPGMSTQSLGFLDNPPVYTTRLSSVSVTSTSTFNSTSTSSSGSSTYIDRDRDRDRDRDCDRDRDRDRPTEINRYDFSKSNAVKKGTSTRKGSHSEVLPKGFICPTRSEWSKSGSLAHT